MGSQTKLIGFSALAFLLGIGLASGLEREGTTTSRPAPRIQIAAPERADVQRVADLSDAFIAISEAVTPAVVRIQAERTAAPDGLVPPGLRDLFGMPPRREAPVPQVAGGSGFVVTPDGYILTNNHVIDGADLIHVILVDKRVYPATVVGHDPTTDVAVIKIDATNLAVLSLGDSEEARVGEWVLAVGNPGFSDASTLDFTVTSGIISAKGRPLNIINQELAAGGNEAASFAIEDFIQTDAAINPGNSGGPLVNLRGEVVGINTAIASSTGGYQGYGFAIPSNLALRVMRDLVEHGQVRRALLGISIANVTPEDAAVFQLNEIRGVIVEDFAGDSPAMRSGIQRGDVLVSLGGTPIERVGQLQRLVAQHRPGESVDVEVVRYGRTHTYQIRLMEAPIASAPPAARPARQAARGRPEIGIEVADVTAAVARELGLDRPGGAIVARVQAMSAADRKGVRREDRILAIDQKPVASAREAQAALRAARSGEHLSLLLQGADGRTRFANIRVP
jgi:serine protease Do